MQLKDELLLFLMNKFLKYYIFMVIWVFMGGVKNIYGQNEIPGQLSLKGKYTSDIKNSKIVVPQRVNKDGSFISHLVSHHHSKRSTKESDIIFYKIPIEGKNYLVELTPNRKLISGRAIVEIHKENNGNPERKSKKETLKNESLKNDLKNFKMKKLENTECHFSGHVKGEIVSKAALSTCYGLAGFIQINEGFYTIEPVAGHDPFVEGEYPHILYRGDSFENSSVCRTIGELKKSLTKQFVRKKRESNLDLSVPMYIETLVVMDKSFINHQDSDCENYVLTVFNMAFNLFNDASLGLMITLTIVRIIRLEVGSDEVNLTANIDAEKILQNFQKWQYEINPGDDSHPNHHDIAILLTRVNACRSLPFYGLLGLTIIGKACDPKLSAALCEDTGLRLGFIIAHEIGHLLGADHDPVNSTYKMTDHDRSATVMNPQVSLTAQTWSEYSQAYFKTFFDSGMGSCLLDEPEEHHFNVQDLLPGVMYNADFQCKHILSMNARECDMGSTCDSLNCYIPGYACIVTHTPPADGTRCGENMWCHNSKCLVIGERPGAVDGNWGEWSAWSECSRTCGSGVAYSIRQCDKPSPSHGGKNCIGERKKYKICAATMQSLAKNITTDPQNISDLIRDIQCGEFNDWIYPEDGKSHTWKAYHLHDDNPCTLYCINEEKQVAALRSRVIDGTMCYRGIRDICIGGICKNVPCDLHFDSNAIEDVCGVCHGDGTECDFSEGTETLSKLYKGVTKLVNVPSGTRNIKVEEMSPTLAKIIVRDKDTKAIYIRGKTLGMFNVPGSQAWLGMIKKNQEALNIPGPVSKPLSIWIQRLENVTVKWSMALPVEQQRKPEFTWDFLKWGPCSAKCGPGTQKSEPNCMEEKAGLVEDTFCADMEMPPAKVRPCEIAKCEPRWMVGDWKDCDSSKKKRKRIVYCVKPIGEGEGESEIITDSQCPQPKPHITEACKRRRKREDSEFDTNYFFEASMYKSDSDDPGFHKKYDDYLKHFTAVSVPQRKSETIPLHLISSPHFKHYFRVLETPENEGSDSEDLSEISTNYTRFGNESIQGKASPDFYKNTFSGHQIDVSHIHSKTCFKDVNYDVSSGGRIKKNLWFRHLRNTQRTRNLKPKQHKFLKRYFEPQNRKKYINFSQALERSKRRSRLNNQKKGFKYVARNLTHLVDKLSEGDDYMKNIYLKLIEKGKIEELSRNEKRKWNWNAYNQKNPLLENLKKSVSNFLSPKEAAKDKPKLHSEVEDIQELSSRKITPKGFDGSGMRKIFFGNITRSKLKSNHILESLHKKKLQSNPFNPMFSGTNFDTYSYKSKHTANLLEKPLKNIKKENSRFSYNIESPFSQKSGFSRKKKRANYKWKKPKLKDSGTKSNKETSGSGAETKKYLNLFRENHAKNRKQGQKPYLKKTVINTGQLVVDKDTIDNQRIEIFFLEDDEETTQRIKRLPKPHRNEKKLTLKGRQAFDLLHRLRSERQAYFKTNDVSENDDSDKTEMNIKKPNHNKGLETTKSPETSPRSSETSSSTQTTQGVTKRTDSMSTKTTPVTTIKTTKAITTTSSTRTTTKNPETLSQIVVTIPKTESAQPTSTTNSEAKSTTKQGVTESVEDIDCFDYDVDENIPETDTTAQPNYKKKEKKKKLKEKSKLEE